MNIHTNAAALREAYAADDLFAHEPHHDARSTTALGFWIYLMSDCVLFASLFATFAVLHGSTAGGPGPKELFKLPYVAVETAILLVSSLTYGVAMIGAERKSKGWVLAALGVTFLLGASFLGMEIHEFRELIAEGAGPARSGFLSAFFTLVGTHGLHVFCGLVWMAVVMVHVAKRGFEGNNPTSLMCLSLFWHFLDIVWIGVFTFVYLMGVA